MEYLGAYIWRGISGRISGCLPLVEYIWLLTSGGIYMVEYLAEYLGAYLWWNVWLPIRLAVYLATYL